MTHVLVVERRYDGCVWMRYVYWPFDLIQVVDEIPNVLEAAINEI